MKKFILFRKKLKKISAFTIFELLVGSFLAIIVLGVILSTLIGMKKLYYNDAVRSELHQNLRIASTILSSNTSQIGNNLNSYFPALELVNGVSGNSDVFTIRKALVKEFPRLCEAVSSSTIYIASGNASGCAYSANSKAMMDAWKEYRLSKGGSVRAFIYDSITKQGEFFLYIDEVDDGDKYGIVKSTPFTNSYTLEGTSIYLIEELKFERENDELKLTINGDETKIQTIAFNLTDFQVTLFDNTELSNIYESFTRNDQWTNIRDVQITIPGRAASAGEQFTNLLSVRVTINETPKTKITATPTPIVFPSIAPSTGPSVVPSVIPSGTPVGSPTPIPSPTPVPTCPPKVLATCTGNEIKVNYTNSYGCPAQKCGCAAMKPCAAGYKNNGISGTPCSQYSCTACPVAPAPHTCYTLAMGVNYPSHPFCEGLDICGKCKRWFCNQRANGGQGCFAYGTKVTMFDGTQRLVEDVRDGELLLNAVTGKPLKVLDIVEGPEEISIIQVKSGEIVLKISSEHVMVTENGIKKAKSLTLHDKLLSADGKFKQIDTLENLPILIGQRVINFTLAEREGANLNNHLLVSEGLVTGDLYLQNSFDKFVNSK